MSKEEYLKYKKAYFNMRYELFKREDIKNILDYKIVEDYNYSPDKSLCILLKLNNHNEFIWNDKFLSFESLEDNQELSNKVNKEFFQYFSWTFRNEWNEYELF